MNRLSALEDLRARKRSPRRHQQARTLPAITGPLYFPLPASSSGQPEPPAPKGKAKGNKRGSKGKQQKGNRNSGSGGTKKFADILASQADRRLLHASFHNEEPCFQFQKGSARWPEAASGCPHARDVRVTGPTMSASASPSISSKLRSRTVRRRFHPSLPFLSARAWVLLLK